MKLTIYGQIDKTNVKELLLQTGYAMIGIIDRTFRKMYRNWIGMRMNHFTLLPCPILPQPPIIWFLHSSITSANTSKLWTHAISKSLLEFGETKRRIRWNVWECIAIELRKSNPNEIPIIPSLPAIQNVIGDPNSNNNQQSTSAVPSLSRFGYLRLLLICVCVCQEKRCWVWLEPIPHLGRVHFWFEIESRDMRYFWIARGSFIGNMELTVEWAENWRSDRMREGRAINVCCYYVYSFSTD